MYPQVLFQNRKPDRIASMEEYRASGGYEALADPAIAVHRNRGMV